MQLTPHTSTDYADAQRALLPPGAAFDWPQGGFGDTLLKGMGEELARIGASAQTVLDIAIEPRGRSAVERERAFCAACALLPLGGQPAGYLGRADGIQAGACLFMVRGYYGSGRRGELWTELTAQDM